MSRLLKFRAWLVDLKRYAKDYDKLYYGSQINMYSEWWAYVGGITAEEYGCLRKSFLPENGISQEGATLEFLSTFASFYACADALVCANQEEQVVFEYLGNPHSAPGILSALSVKSAEIPTPGQDISFAMWHPLNCTKKPGYLGISLE